MKPVDDPVKLLVVEDDHVLGKTITNGLTEEGYHCRLASSGVQALEMAQAENYQIVILDLALEDESALGILRCVREANENANVIILTPLEFRQERKAGLEAGADDFLIKPFALHEMRARVEAALIRSKARPKSLLEIGPLSMNLTTRKVTCAGKQLSLTPTEFRILEILLRNNGKVVTRRMLCEFLWEPGWEGVTNVIEVHINRLRSKLKSAETHPTIQTIRGSGYALQWVPDSSSGRESATVPGDGVRDNEPMA